MPAGVEELKNTYRGTVYLVGSGPSLDDFPISRLRRTQTIALNGAIASLKHATYWLFGDGRFARWEAKKFKGVQFEKAVMNEKHVQWWKGDEDKVLTFTNGFPDQPNFLPGRWTIATVGLSLARLIGARRVVMIGIDMGVYRDEHYAADVPSKPPRKQEDLMGCWRKWMQHGFRQELWPMDVVTTSPCFNDNCTGTPVKQVTVKEALC